MAAKNTTDAGMAKVEAKEPASKKHRRRRGIDKRILSQMFMMPPSFSFVSKGHLLMDQGF